MAKRATKVLPARKELDAAFDDDSLLVRSAESLGRVIGSLQRQVHGSSRRLASLTDDTIEAVPNIPRLDDIFGPAPARKRTGTRKSASRKGATARKTSARKVSAARKGTAKRKSAAAKKR